MSLAKLGSTDLELSLFKRVKLIQVEVLLSTFAHLVNQAELEQCNVQLV